MVKIIKIKLKVGDITKETTDVIINSANHKAGPALEKCYHSCIQLAEKIEEVVFI